MKTAAKINDIFARVLLCREKDHKLCHILWANNKKAAIAAFFIYSGNSLPQHGNKTARCVHVRLLAMRTLALLLAVLEGAAHMCGNNSPVGIAITEIANQNQHDATMRPSGVWGVISP